MRAQVVDTEVKDAFDRWYQDERLVVEFDRAWGDKVTRSYLVSEERYVRTVTWPAPGNGLQF